MITTTTEEKSYRRRLFQRLGRFRHRSSSRPNSTDIRPLRDNQADSGLATNSDPVSHSVKPTVDSLSLNQASDAPEQPTSTGVHKVQIQPDQCNLHSNNTERSLTTSGSAEGDDIDSGIISSDLWSAAYREAVESLREELDITILKGKSVAQLFQKLEEIDNEATQESAFMRGVRYLHSMQKPLESIKMALDLASPLANLEPVATTVVGVLRSVTAIAISIATADVEFGKQITEMLKQISYIDDCDTLGQKADDKDIHKALVLVYQKLLEFYKVAFDILTRKGAKLIMKVILENDRLPNIVQEFLSCSETLRHLIEKSMWEIMQDVQTMLYHSEIARWLGSDKMSRQSQYHAELQNLRADRACHFLLKNAKFVSWCRDSNSQQLVILGDKGHGKTVSMAFLVDELSRRNMFQLPQPKLCYYYCRDDETGQAIHIFSALILSLLEQLPGLKKPFFGMYKQAQASGVFDPATNVKIMEEFLQKLLEAVDRPVFAIIDGLDECDRASRDTLLKALKTLSTKIPGFKTVLSSRPQEEILEQLNDVPRIDLVSDTERDRIIAEEAVEKQLDYLSTDVKALVINSLSQLAQGSAIWTKMTVNLIEKRKITARDPMRRFLETILLPPKLSELYVALFLRCTSDDYENQELARTALKLLAISRRPLSIAELTWAVTLGVSQHVTKVADLAERVDHRRLMSLIDPFISRIDFNDIKKRQVRLVHQSVKEFIIEKWTSDHPPALVRTDQASSDRRAQDLEACILDICVRYLLLDDIGNSDLFPEELVAIAELPQGSDLFDEDKNVDSYDAYCSWDTWEEDMIQYDPADRGFGEFFVYASCHWLEHYGAITAESELFPSLASIESLCQAGSTRLLNWIQQNPRPNCAINARFEFEGSLYDPLSITSLYGSEAMLRYMLKNSDFDKGKFLQKTAVCAADQILQWGDIKRLRILFLDDQFRRQLQNLDFFHLVIKHWFHPRTKHDNWDAVFELVGYVSDQMVQEHWGNELLCMAARAGCMPLVRQLMANAQQDAELRSELLGGSRYEQQSPTFVDPTHQSIGEAVLGNHADVVECLLAEKDIEAHIRYTNSRGENVLHLASTICNPEMFRLLIPRFPEGMHQVDHQGDTALVRLIMNTSSGLQSRYDSAKIMLSESSTDWTSHYHDGQREPLGTAVRLGDLDMCSLLISQGNISPLSALAYDNEGQIGLKDRPPENEEKALQILQLLCEHADIQRRSPVH